MKPLRAFVAENRETITPNEMPTLVDHYSIPALDSGAPEVVESTTIDSHKIHLRGGELLISRLNPRKPRVHLTPRTLSRPSVASTEFVTLRVRSGDARYLRYRMLAEDVRQDLDSKVRSATRSHQRVEPGEILSTPVPMYSAHEQRRIADFLDDRVARIDHIITARRAQVSALDDAARATLAERMLAGGNHMPLRHLVVDERLGLWGAEPGEDEVDAHVARVADFERAEFRLGEVPTVRSATLSQIAPRALRHGDVLLERSGGTSINPVGCPAFVDHPAPDTVSSNFVSRLRPVADADGRYLSLLLGALYATGQQRPHSNQTTGIQNLDTTSYLHVRIPERGHAVQVALAQEVDDALSGIRGQQGQLRESTALLKEYKQSLITAAVTGELDVTTASTGLPS